MVGHGLEGGEVLGCPRFSWYVWREVEVVDVLAYDAVC